MANPFDLDIEEEVHADLLSRGSLLPKPRVLSPSWTASGTHIRLLRHSCLSCSSPPILTLIGIFSQETNSLGAIKETAYPLTARLSYPLPLKRTYIETASQICPNCLPL